MRKCVFLLVPVLLLTAGCKVKPKFTEEELAQIPLTQKTDLPKPSGGFVLVVGSETITSDEIITGPLLEHFRPFAQRNDFERFKKWAKPQLEQIVVTKVSDILLYNQAKKEAGEDIEERLEKLADGEVRKFVASFGGDYAKAEEALKEMRMDWHSFKEYQKKMILSQSYIASQLGKNKLITYSELLEYYNRMKDESFTAPAKLKFRLIDIQIEKLEVADPNQSRQQFAKKLAKELLGRIQAGEDFGELAAGYPQGQAIVWRIVETSSPESLAEPYDILATRAKKVEPGQTAGPIEAGEHIFIMKLEEKQAESVEPLENVQKQVEEKIIFDRWKKAVGEFRAKLVQQAAPSKKSEFINFCLEKIYLMSNQ